MAFRAVRTAAVLTCSLLLFTGCQRDDGNGGGMRTAEASPDTTLPPDAIPLPADQLTRLPWYGAQHLECEEARDFLEARYDTVPTDTVRLAVEGDRLVIDPTPVIARPGDTITWDAQEGLVWKVVFKERRLSGDRPPTLSGDRTGSIIPDEPESCGRDYFFVVAYDQSEDRVYLTDPPRWVY